MLVLKNKMVLLLILIHQNDSASVRIEKQSNYIYKITVLDTTKPLSMSTYFDSSMPNFDQ